MASRGPRAGAFVFGVVDGHCFGVHDFPPLPVMLDGDAAVQVESGRDFCVALSTAGRVYSCFGNSFGQLGLGDRDHRESFQPITIPGPRVRKVVCGGCHALVLNEDGQLFSWGRGTEGQLGHGDNNSVLKPKWVQHFKTSEVVDVAASEAFTAAVVRREDGQLNLMWWGKGGVVERDGSMSEMFVNSSEPIMVQGQGALKAALGTSARIAIHEQMVTVTCRSDVGVGGASGAGASAGGGREVSGGGGRQASSDGRQASVGRQASGSVRTESRGALSMPGVAFAGSAAKRAGQKWKQKALQHSRGSPSRSGSGGGGGGSSSASSLGSVTTEALEPYLKQLTRVLDLLASEVTEPNQALHHSAFDGHGPVLQGTKLPRDSTLVQQRIQSASVELDDDLGVLQQCGHVILDLKKRADDMADDDYDQNGARAGATGLIAQQMALTCSALEILVSVRQDLNEAYASQVRYCRW